MKNARDNRIRLHLLVTVAGLALTASTASAGVNTWTTNGPEGGAIRALVVDPANPATLYAGTSGGGVFKSTNGGDSWRSVNTGLTSPGVQALAIDPWAPGTLYAAGYSDSSVAGGIFKSTNGGESWTPANAGLTNTYVQTLAIDPESPSTVYAGTGAGVFKSTDGAANWTGLNGLTGASSLAIDPSAPGTLYAVGYSDSGARGVFKSSNGGESWTLTFRDPDNTYVSALAIDPSAPSTLYAGAVSNFDWPPPPSYGGLYRSTDGGANWTASLLDHDVLALAIAPSAPATLYASAGGGVLKSTNGGATWTQRSLPGNRSVFAFAIYAGSPWDYGEADVVYAGSFDGVLKSSDGGGSWTTAINAGLIASEVNTLAIDPSAPGTLYAGTSAGGVFKSTNGGGSWTAMNVGLTSTFVSALAIDPSAPNTLFAGTQGDGVFKSSDGAESWTAMNAGLTGIYVSALAIDPSASGTLLVAAPGSGVFKSTDGGVSWTAVNNGLTTYSIHTLAIDPSAPTTLYAAGDEGVFKSTDGGTNWTCSLPGHGGYTLAMDPRAPTTLYSGDFGNVYKTTNAGGVWTAVSAGFTHLSVNALAIDPSDPDTLYAGTIEGGVFKSADAGSTWTKFNAGLRNPWVNALAIDPLVSSRLYAGTRGGGVFDYLDSSCSPSATTLCLSGGRFKVTTEWATAAGQSGSGRAVTLAGGDTGYFTFFDTGNVEVAVKVLNGCDSSGSFWVFAGGLTNVGVVMTVTDSLTGTVKSYSNPQGTPFGPIEDTNTFATCAAGSTGGVRPYDSSVAGLLLPPSVSESFEPGATAPCVANATTLCLSNSRYQVRAQWLTQDGHSGAGQMINLTGDTGAFWFFSPSNVEVVVKVLNGCGSNSRYWTFAGGLTDVNVILAVTDTQTGAVKTYINPQGIPFEPIQDTNAFATCP